MATGNSTLHHRAQVGFADGASYDRGRPTYSAFVVQQLLEELRVSGRRGAKILDLAAGTGKFTEALAAREEEFEIIAVEPHDEMRRVLEAKKLPRVQVMPGLADALPLEEESVDAVICAQAFHWFANLPALREIHRVVRPHGTLGLVWNLDGFNWPKSETPPTGWESVASEIMWTYDDEQPRVRHAKWQAVFDEQIKSSPLALLTASEQLFSLPLGEHREEFEVRLPKEKMWERFNTYSQIATLEGEERERVYKKFMDAIDNDEQARDENGDIVLHGYTLAAWTTKIPEDGREDLTSVERPGS